MSEQKFVIWKLRDLKTQLSKIIVDDGNDPWIIFAELQCDLHNISEEEETKCIRCSGTGIHIKRIYKPIGHLHTKKENCISCNGTGKIHHDIIRELIGSVTSTDLENLARKNPTGWK